jgi:hypothetical protein
MMSNNNIDLFGGGGDSMDLLRRRLFQMPPGGYGEPMMQQRPVMMGQPIAQPDMHGGGGQPMPVGNWDQTQKNWAGAGKNFDKAKGLLGA